MLPPSVRVAASSVSHSSLFPAHSIACHAPTAALSLCRRQGGLQRRYSSSKPNSPKNRQNAPKAALPAGDVSTSASESGSSDVKASGEKRKRKSKASDAAANNPFSAMPSVPNTHHLSSEALGLTNFFSIHRPISITHSVPKPTSDEAFAEIFASKIRANKAADVISTLSRVVEDIEGPMAKLTLSKDSGEQQAGENTPKIEISHNDGSGASMFLSKSMGQFLPFQPPPIPRPESAENQVMEPNASNQFLDLESNQRTYRAMFTIEETMDAEGQVHVMAHSPKVLDEASAARYSRRIKYVDAIRRRHELYAISVKKRRKLKMKKKKFKKKLKGSRKLRERLHKI